MRTVRLGVLVVLWAPCAASAVFCDPVHYPSGGAPLHVVARDVDNDGLLDLAVANHATDDVSILRGRADGTFLPAINFPAGDGPASLALARFDGDANLDVAVADEMGTDVSLLLGDGAGAFAASMQFGVASNPHGLAAGDVDGDGDADMVVANSGEAKLSVLLGDGSGTFAPSSHFGTSTSPGGPVAVTIGLFDADGYVDAVTANYYSGSVSVFLGDGAGGFGPAAVLAAGAVPRDVVASDLNLDGRLDLIVPNEGHYAGMPPGDIAIFWGSAGGVFTAPVTYLAGNGPTSVAVGDVDGDDVTDILVANHFGDDVSVLLGDGAGGFGPSMSVPAGTVPRSVAVGDFNGDGRLDIVVAAQGDNGVSVLLQRDSCPGSTTTTTSTTSTTTPLPPDCSSAPLTGCVGAAKASLTVDERVVGRERLKVKASGLAAAITQADFGNPVSGSTKVSVCVYGESEALVAAMIVERAGMTCGTRPCWKALGATGYKYSDPFSSAFGVSRIVGKGGSAGKGKVLVTGKNDVAKGQASLPTAVAALLEGETSAAVQVQTGDARCFEARLTTIRRSTANHFKATLP